MKTRHSTVKITARLFLTSSLMIVAAAASMAQDVFQAQMGRAGRIDITVSEPSVNNPGDDPVVKIFEVVSVGDKKKTFERAPLRVRMPAGSGQPFTASVDIPPPADGFDHYEVEVLNYKTKDGTENFRGAISTLAAAFGPTNGTLGSTVGGKEIDVQFTGPDKDKMDWGQFRAWLTTASTSGATLNVKLENGKTSQRKIVKASFIEAAPECVALSQCTLLATLVLDKPLPIGQPAGVKLSFPDAVFDPAKEADNLPLDPFRHGISLGTSNIKALGADPKRDPVRTNVLEVGGNLNTSAKLDPDPATNKIPARKTDGSLDLRVATPTITFADNITTWWTWTPAQVDAMVSTGKLTGSSLSTNTMRLFTQVQHAWRTGDHNYTFYRLVGEGGAAADRDLRVIEYTGIGDFRFNPGFLNRVLDKNPPPDLGKTITAEFTPFGFELGHRQVRRDPLFVADDFIRRFRFAEKMELLLPPYFQFDIEDRSWVRGEVAKNKFKNYFITSFTLYPTRLNSLFSAGVTLSYERGSQPPFTTQRVSTFKLGFRVRKREW
jgi:hypothetical protein